MHTPTDKHPDLHPDLHPVGTPRRRITADTARPVLSSILALLLASILTPAVAAQASEPDNTERRAGSLAVTPSCSERCERRQGPARTITAYDHLADAADETRARMLADIAALADHLARRERAPLRTATGFDLHRPVPGAVGSPFGPRLHPILGVVRPHRGVDLAAPAGTPVLAAGPGRVLRAGPAGDYGILVAVAHDDSTETRYAHLSRTLVHAGDHVLRGQAIGEVGSTGLSTGPHLHFELRVENTPVDPAPWLP